MTQTKTALFFHKADQLEVNLCLSLNRISRYNFWRHFFSTASRLGDGVLWYGLMLSLPLWYGVEGIKVSLFISACALICVGIYKALKHHLVRERPFISFPDVLAVVKPLDYYSFPSGHTMNAVNFTILFIYFFPLLAWILVPFATIVALSRIVLGMHYPTDVLVGGLFGALIGFAGIELYGLL